jgi:ATP-dependent Clp protease ATP-binding subunit ClpA
LDDGNESNSLILNIRKQPFSVVLLDEIEKAHSNILNLMLQLLDEGQLTDVSGRPASFRNAIIILTSNAGSKDILARIASGQGLTNFERPLINQLIEQGIFRAELVNRFDEIVLFRSLNQAELMQVAQLMLGEVNKTLANQNISVELTPAALEAMVQAGYDPQFGARPMRRVIQRTVEDAMATKILSGEAQPGTKVLLDLPDLHIEPANTQNTQQATPPTPPPAQPVGP